jgi:hypothetical protein
MTFSRLLPPGCLSQNPNQQAENLYEQKVFGDCQLTGVILFRPLCVPMSL